MIRFIADAPHSAVFNMAADQYLLEQCSGTGTVFVRFYLWESPTITLGCMQKPGQILDPARLENDSVYWIKRPTGGRAVLHDEDLTYSCIFPGNLSFMGSTVQQSYRIITGCLLRGLVSAGISCQAHDTYDDFLNVKREIKLPCFLAPNRNEIMVDGKKLVGSAQRRTANGVLQHGSIPLSANYRRLPQYLNISEEERDNHQTLLSEKSICIREINRNIAAEDLIRALQQGFREKLGGRCTDMGWTDHELSRINELASSEQFRNRWLS